MTSLAYSAFESGQPQRTAAFTVADFVDRVRGAVGHGTVENLSRTLEATIAEHPNFLPERFLIPKAETYARREIYTDPEGKFSILVMVWAPGQGTPVHDHGGMWVVEVVYKGLVTVRNFDHVGVVNGLHQFLESEEKLDTSAHSDFRVPPEEYHQLSNNSSEPAVTIHIFGGVLNECNIFAPVEGGYQKVAKAMLFD